MSISVLDMNRKIDNILHGLQILIEVCCGIELMQVDVPLEYQDDDFSCTPLCILMVLRYLANRFTSGFPNLDLATISEAVKASADIGGTNFKNIHNVNSLFDKTSPSLDIVPSFRCKFEEIIEEIKKHGRPVIAWIMMPDPNGDFEHSVVVTDVDEQKLLIYCNDPVYGRTTIPTRKFIEMWNGCFRILIKFKIGEKVTLYDFS